MAKKKTGKTQDFEAWLVLRLKNNPAEAAAYINECLLDNGEGDYEAVLLMAMRHVAKAYGMGKVASKAKRSRESLYKTLSQEPAGGLAATGHDTETGSQEGDPKLSTFTSLLNALGLRLRIEPGEIPARSLQTKPA